MSQKKWRKLRKERVAVQKVEGRLEGDGVLDVLRKNWRFLGLISMLAVVVYANGMAADFVSDDYASITQNPLVGNLAEMGKNMATFTNYVIFKLFGHNSSVPYHLTSLVAYIVFIWLAYVVLYMVFNDRWLATVTMLIFSIHPIHVETVTWISGRIYLLVSISIMLTFLFFIYYLRKRYWGWVVWAGVTFFLGFITDKPRPFSLFMVIWLYFIYIGLGRLRVDWKKSLLVMVGIATVFLMIAIPQINRRVVSVNSGYNASESVFYNPFFQYPTGLAKYLQLLWLPVDLTLYHTMYTFPIWLNWAIILTYLATMTYFYFRDKRYFFALGFILAGVLPSMAPLKVSWLVAERYIFLGSLGFCLLIALVLKDIWQRWSLVAVSLMAVIMVAGAARIYLRNIDWQTNHNLWVNTCQVSPNSHNAWNNIGDDYDKLKDYENAIKGFTQSTVVKPNYADAFHNRANIFFKIGRLDLARDSYNTALYFSPSLYQTYVSLTQIDMIEKKFDLAMTHAKQAIQLQPENPQALYVLGVVYAQAGMRNEAVDLLKKILSVYPNYQPAREALAGLLGQ